jgi:tRNA pseudouridine38-40 synthase
VRLRLHIAYEGTDYCGWQIQPDEPTVEGELLRAAATILDTSPDSIQMQGASRTDSGVHAEGQVAHLDCKLGGRRLWEMVRGFNGLTADDIGVQRVEEAPDDFDARFHSQGKRYRYRIWNHRFEHPLRHRRLWRVGRSLDRQRMKRAAAKLEGDHDFEAFRTADCDSESTRRIMHRVEVQSDGPEIAVVVEGNAFLKYMVRVMVGTLVDIAAGSLEEGTIDRMFQTGERGEGGITAPAKGLTLEEVFYPDHPWRGEPPRIGGDPLSAPWL